jgi:23S rRNA (guanosine2251-2'-O)-methyltransferase
MAPRGASSSSGRGRPTRAATPPAGGRSGRPKQTSTGRPGRSGSGSSSGSGSGTTSGNARSSGGRTAAGGGRQFNSRGAGRTGGITRPGEQIRELLIAGKRKVKEIWVASDLDVNEVIDDIIALARNERVQLLEVNRRKIEAVARSEAPQGVIAFAQMLPEADFNDFLKRRPGRAPFLVAVDGVTDPGNLGALLRCCDGAGVDGVVLPRHRAVHITPTAAKSAAGAIEHVPMAVVGGLPAALARMKDAGIWIIGLDDASDRSLFELGDIASEGVCLVLGAEGAGLSRLARERCDVIVSIPMLGRLSSLNVSAAAALATYEIARARPKR